MILKNSCLKKNKKFYKLEIINYNSPHLGARSIFNIFCFCIKFLIHFSFFFQYKEEFSVPFILNIHLHDSKNDKDSNKNIHREIFNRTRYLHCKNEVSS